MRTSESRPGCVNLSVSSKKEVAGICTKNGELQNTTSGNTVATERLREKAGTIKEKLDGRHQTGSEGHEH